MKQRRYVVLDRDGTIIVERHYLSDPRQVELVPGAITGLRQLNEMGLGLVIITNQSGVGRGFLDEVRLQAIHKRLCELLETGKVNIDGIYFCPHLPETNCECRKPKPGLLNLASKELNFNPRSCFVIGDKACDIEMGQWVGATTILVRTGYGDQVAADGIVTPDHVVNNLWGAALVIKGIILEGETREEHL